MFFSIEPLFLDSCLVAWAGRVAGWENPQAHQEQSLFFFTLGLFYQSFVQHL